MTALLFIRSRNRIRSLTTERLCDGLPGYRARSAGTAEGARISVTEGHIRWADHVFVMERRHRSLLRARFGDLLAGKPITVLDIPDDFTYMDEELCAIMRGRLAAELGSQFPVFG